MTPGEALAFTIGVLLCAAIIVLAPMLTERAERRHRARKLDRVARANRRRGELTYALIADEDTPADEVRRAPIVLSREHRSGVLRVVKDSHANIRSIREARR